MAADAIERAIVAVGYSYDHGGERAAIAGMGSVLAAAGAATLAIVGLGRQQAEANDALAKTARDLDIPIGRLQAYRQAAELAGIGSQQMEAGLGQLQRSIMLAASGTGQQADIFARLGIDARDATGELRSAADVFELLGSRLDRLGSTADQNAALQLLVGGRGLQSARMRQLLMQGADGIDEVEARLRSFGAVVDDDVAAASEQLVDAFSWLGMAAQGVAQDLSRELIPALVPLVTTLGDVIGSADGLVRSLASLAGSTIGAAFRGLNTEAGAALGTVAAVAAAIGSVSAAGSLLGAASAAVPVLGGMAAAASGAAVPVLLLGSVLGATLIALDALSGDAREAADATRGLTDAQREAAESADPGVWGLLTEAYATARAGLRAFGLTIAETAGFAAGLTMQAWDMLAPIRSMIAAIPGVELFGEALSTVAGFFGDIAERATDTAAATRRFEQVRERFDRGDLVGGLGVAGGLARGEVEQTAADAFRRFGEFRSTPAAQSAASTASTLGQVALPQVAIARATYNISATAEDAIVRQLERSQQQERRAVLAQIRGSR